MNSFHYEFMISRNSHLHPGFNIWNNLLNRVIDADTVDVASFGLLVAPGCF